jgi:hypothetical protein
MTLYTQTFDQLPISPSPQPSQLWSKSKLNSLRRSNTITELINLSPALSNKKLINKSSDGLKPLKSVLHCEIHMAKDMACLGEINSSRAIIQGIVKLDLVKDLVIDEFNINIRGECKLTKSNLFTNNNDDSDDGLQFLNFSKVIVEGGGKGLRFCERQYYIPFEFLIIDDLPSTYSSGSAKITYSIQIAINSSKYTPLVISKPFKLIRCWLNPNYFDLQSGTQTPSSLASGLSSSSSTISFPTQEIIQTSNNLLIKLSSPKIIFPNEKYAIIKLELETFKGAKFPKFVKFTLIQITSVIKPRGEQVRKKVKKYLIRNLNLMPNGEGTVIRLDTLLWIFKTPKVNFSLNSNFIKVEHLLKVEFNYPIYWSKNVEVLLPVQLQAYPKNLLELGSPPTYVPPPRYSTN